MMRLLDKSEVADLLHVSARTVDRLRAGGDLRSLRVRGTVRFNPQDVQAFINCGGDGKAFIPLLTRDLFVSPRSTSVL
jgi:excisionase family DNA binding protein